MYNLSFALLFALFITGLNCTVTFISPNASVIWTVGQKQIVSWKPVSLDDNPNNDYLSVRLYQMFPNGTATTSFEYVLRSAGPDTVTVDVEGWSVQLNPAVGFDPSISNTYIFLLYLESETRPLATSKIITIKNTTTSSSPSNSTRTTNSTTKIFALSTSTSTSSTSPRTCTATPNWEIVSSSVVTASKPPSTQLSAVAKVGIAIGAVAVIIQGVLLRLFLLGRRKRQNGNRGVPLTTLPPHLREQERWHMPELSNYGAASKSPGPKRKSPGDFGQYAEVSDVAARGSLLTTLERRVK